MSATALGAIATAIANAVDNVSGLKVYGYEPRDLDSLPAATVLGPTTFERTAPEESESQLGSSDWHLTYTVRLYVANDNPDEAMTSARSYLGQVIAAVDADRTLGLGYVLDASVTSGEFGYSDPDDEHARQMMIYDCALQVWALIS